MMRFLTGIVALAVVLAIAYLVGAALVRLAKDENLNAAGKFAVGFFVVAIVSMILLVAYYLGGAVIRII